MKKVFAGIALMAMMSFVAVPSANAQTSVADLQALIESLTAQIAALQGQVGGNTSGGTSTGAGCYTFTQDLTIGSTGAEATNLQMVLVNAGNLVMPAGVPMGYFGSLTQAALGGWQAAHGVAPAAGYWGPISRAAYAASCVPVPSTPLPPVNNGGSDDDDDDFSTTIDRATGDTEGDITDFELEDPDQDTINEGEKMVEVAEIDFQVEFSPVELSRIDIALDSITPLVEDDPWNAFDMFYVEFEGDILAEVDADDEDLWEKDDFDNDSVDEHRLRISRLNQLLEEGDHTVRILADISGGLDGVDSGAQQQWELFVPTSGSDGALFIWPNGVTEFEGSNERADFSLIEAGADTELEISLSADNPDSDVIPVENSNTSDEELLTGVRFRADEGEVEVNELQVTIDIFFPTSTVNTSLTLADTDNIAEAAQGVIAFNTVIDDVFFVCNDVDEDFESADFANSAAIFALGTELVEIADLNSDGHLDVRAIIDIDLEDNSNELELDEDESANCEFQVRFEAQGSGSLAANQNYPENTEVRLSVFTSDDVATTLVNENNLAAWDVESDDEDLTTTAGQLSGSAVGDIHTLLEEGLDIEFVSTDVTQFTNDAGEVVRAELETIFAVEAFGDDFFIPLGATTTSGVTVDGVIFTMEDPNTNTASVGFDVMDNITAAVLSSNADEADQNAAFWRVDPGRSENFTLRVNVTSDSASTTTNTFIGSIRTQLESLQFADEVTGPVTTLQFLPREHFESDDVTLTA